jgi:hypothetical protein
MTGTSTLAKYAITLLSNQAIAVLFSSMMTIDMSLLVVVRVVKILPSYSSTMMIVAL